MKNVMIILMVLAMLTGGLAYWNYINQIETETLIAEEAKNLINDNLGVANLTGLGEAKCIKVIIEKKASKNRYDAFAFMENTTLEGSNVVDIEVIFIDGMIVVRNKDHYKTHFE